MVSLWPQISNYFLNMTSKVETIGNVYIINDSKLEVLFNKGHHKQT